VEDGLCHSETLRHNAVKFISDKYLAERFEVSRATIWRWAREGKFPTPFKIQGSTRWKLSEVEQWEAKQEGAA
jgi:prophage regulatory protein